MIPIWFPKETYRLGVIIFRWKQLLVIHRPRNFSWWPRSECLAWYFIHPICGKGVVTAHYLHMKWANCKKNSNWNHAEPVSNNENCSERDFGLYVPLQKCLGMLDTIKC
jgi:hypothetical protein